MIHVIYTYRRYSFKHTVFNEDWLFRSKGRTKSTMRVIGVIPARYKSSRLEGKPLADIHGKPMVQHVWERAKLRRISTKFSSRPTTSAFIALSNALAAGQ